MKQHKNNKTTNTLVRSQKRQKKRKRESLTDEDDDDVKVNEWQERYFEITSLLALCFEVK
jgi:hypothetical protein